MSYWIDTHCHLHYPPLLENIDQIIAQALDVDVRLMVCISTKLSDSALIKNLALKYDCLKYTLGQHPCEKTLNAQQVYDQLNELLEVSVDKKLSSSKLIGVGETGLDCTNENLIEQKDIFHAHLELGAKYNLPVVVHSRDMDYELIESLKEFPNAKGVLHCWTGSKETAYKAIELGWKISFSGILTFKKKVEYLWDMAAQLPLNSLVIETDSPFLAPDPYRGKTNQPAFVVEVAKKLSELRGMDIHELQQVLLNNSLELFNIR